MNTASTHTTPHGRGHWIWQRTTAVLMVVPMLYVITSLLGENWRSVEEARFWLTTDINALALIVLVVTGYAHAALGMQVIWEDYVPTLSLRKIAITSTWLVALLCMLSTGWFLWTLQPTL